MNHDDAGPTWIVRTDPDGPGVRLAVKDCIDVAGLPTTVGCPVIAERARPADRDAAVVAAARRSGAQILGKTNLARRPPPTGSGSASATGSPACWPGTWSWPCPRWSALRR